jgi:hypothetical protein
MGNRRGERRGEPSNYELHAKRGTVMFPDGMPMPDGESDFSVTTEWKQIFNEPMRTCKHTRTCQHEQSTCKHCTHCARRDSHDEEDLAWDGGQNGFCLGGQQISLPGTTIHGIVHHINYRHLLGSSYDRPAAGVVEVAVHSMIFNYEIREHPRMQVSLLSKFI